MKYINISNSPCKECARDLIKAFKGEEKPTINFLWVYGSPSSDEKDAEKDAEKQERERNQKFISAIQSLEELVKAGFKVGLWDWKDFSNFLNNSAPTEKLRHIFTNSIRKYANRLNTRGNKTKESIDEVISNYDFFTSELNEDDDEGSQGGLYNFLSSVVTAIIELIHFTVMGLHITYMTKFFIILAIATCLAALIGFVWWHRTHSYGV